MKTDKGIQIDNGDFTRIHNDILEGLASSRFSSLEFRCLIFLMRMTYGWHKKEDTISLSQWAIGVGLDSTNRGNMLNVLNGLIDEGVIYAKSNGKHHPATWGINKPYFDRESVMQPDNTTVMPLDNTTVMQPHNTFEDENEPSVMQPYNSTVMQPHNKSVMQPHNNKRKKESIKDNNINTSLPVEKKETPQQQMFRAVCESIGWDYRTLSKEDRGQVAQACGILGKAGYSVNDVRQFMTQVWFHDWRWEKNQQFPTIKQLRQEIGKIRALDQPVIHQNGKPKAHGNTPKPADPNEDAEIEALRAHIMQARKEKEKNNAPM